MEYTRYDHYMSESMQNLTPRYCQFVVSEYVISVDEGWLIALYNEFRTYRLSLNLEDALENLPDSMNKFMRSKKNV